MLPAATEAGMTKASAIQPARSGEGRLPRGPTIISAPANPSRMPAARPRSGFSIRTARAISNVRIGGSV